MGFGLESGGKSVPLPPKLPRRDIHNAEAGAKLATGSVQDLIRRHEQEDKLKQIARRKHRVEMSLAQALGEDMKRSWWEEYLKMENAWISAWL